MFQEFVKDIVHKVKRAFNGNNKDQADDGGGGDGGSNNVYFGARMTHVSIQSHPFAQLVWFLQSYALEVPGLSLIHI